MSAKFTPSAIKVLEDACWNNGACVSGRRLSQVRKLEAAKYLKVISIGYSGGHSGISPRTDIRIKATRSGRAFLRRALASAGVLKGNS